MPTYIQSDIPVGNVTSGQLVLRNVVIETAVPYKPAPSGGVRDIPCTGDQCRINGDYVPAPDERMILLSDAGTDLMEIDATDGMTYLRSGKWKLVGVFDPPTAASISQQLAANPPANNDAVQKKIFWDRIKILGSAAVAIPLGSTLLQVGRDRALQAAYASGRIAPLDPQKVQAQAQSNATRGALVEQDSYYLAEQITNALSAPLPELPAAPNCPQVSIPFCAPNYQPTLVSYGPPPCLTPKYACTPKYPAPPSPIGDANPYPPLTTISNTISGVRQRFTPYPAGP